MNPEEQALLQQLNDIVAPGQPGWWPLAPGWWVLAIICVVLSVLLYLWRRKKTHRRQQLRWRDSALAEHEKLSANLLSVNEEEYSVHEGLAQLSVLMRRVALAVLPRKQIASQTDDQWLTTLDTIGKTDEYTQGVGQILHRMPYQERQTIAARDIEHLLELTKETILTADKAEPQRGTQPQQPKQQPDTPEEQLQSEEARGASF